MIFFTDFEKRLVIPAWLDYQKVANGTELTFEDARTVLRASPRTQSNLNSDYIDFKNSPTPHGATDLMSSAFNIGEIDIAQEVAKYVKECSGLQMPAKQLAKAILNEPENVTITPTIDAKIAHAKRFLREYPHNPLAWIQCARLYTILGHIEKADNCVRAALQLAPHDRYVARSATRFFIHVGDFERAWQYIRRASEWQFDPWIKATEVSVAELVGKPVKKLKNLLKTSPTPDQLFHNSELIEALGMLEFINGNDHRAKKSFKLAWLNPSRNVITHSEWVVRTKFPSLTEMVEGKFGDSLEATTLQNYFAMRIPEALNSAMEWALEEPFSKRPFALGSSLACSKRDFALAARIARDGLKANPRVFMLRNNLCFALLKSNKVEDGKREFELIPEPANVIEEVVLAATRGLLAYKNGDPKDGRAFYCEAIAKAAGLGEKDLGAKALLNYAITEVEAGVGTANETSTLALKETKGFTAPDILLTRDVLETLIANKESIVSIPDLPDHLKYFSKVRIIPPKFLK